MHLFLVLGVEPSFAIVTSAQRTSFERRNSQAIGLSPGELTTMQTEQIKRRFTALYDLVLARGSTLSCRDAAMTAVDLFLRGTPLPRGRLAA